MCRETMICNLCVIFDSKLLFVPHISDLIQSFLKSWDSSQEAVAKSLLHYIYQVHILPTRETVTILKLVSLMVNYYKNINFYAWFYSLVLRLVSLEFTLEKWLHRHMEHLVPYKTYEHLKRPCYYQCNGVLLKFLL